MASTRIRQIEDYFCIVLVLSLRCFMMIQFPRQSMVICAVFFCASIGEPGMAQVDNRKPAAIETQEVPVVPPELFSKLAQYQSIRGSAFRGWAPDGSGILVSTRFGNAAQLHRVYQPSGRREQITFFDEPVSGMFIPRATDGSILLSMDAGGNENDQVYLLDRQNFQSKLLTDGKAPINWVRFAMTDPRPWSPATCGMVATRIFM